MKYRKLGRTGLEVSQIGVGGHEYRRRSAVKDGRFTVLDPSRPRIIAEAIDRGINYFDTTFTEEAQSLGHTLKEIGATRDRIYVSAMTISPFERMSERPSSQWKAYLESEITDRLQLLQTDYVDVFTLAIVENSYQADRLEAALDAVEDFRKRGLLNFVGISGHDPALMARIIEETDRIDTVLTRINFVLGRSQQLLDSARRKNVGISVMKPFCWDCYGVSFVPVRRRLIDSLPSAGPTAAQLAIGWILLSREVSTVVPGINSIEELIEDAEAGDLEPENLDFSILERLRDYPEVTEGLIELIDHPFEEIRHYALDEVKKRVGKDFGTDKQKYRQAQNAR